MLDFRHETFLALAACGSFTKAAEALNITQPAVSQHIRYLEEHYGCRLVDHSGRKMKLTHEGELLLRFVMAIHADARRFQEALQSLESQEAPFSFGATLTIGEYVMPEILSKLLVKHPDLTFHMSVSNTQTLLERLRRGELDFVVVEGLFDKSEYDATLFSLENFIPVCAPASPFARGQVPFEALTKSRLIVREPGSGTREIFENILQKNNFSLHSFEKVIEIGNMAAIKKMVAGGLGITFLFEAAARRELEEGTLCRIRIPGFSERREFNFVLLKNSFFRDRYMRIYGMMKEAAAPPPAEA